MEYFLCAFSAIECSQTDYFAPLVFCHTYRERYQDKKLMLSIPDSRMKSSRNTKSLSLWFEDAFDAKSFSLLCFVQSYQRNQRCQVKMLQHWLSPNRRRTRELSVTSPKLPKCQRKCVGDFGSSFWRLNSAAFVECLQRRLMYMQMLYFFVCFWGAVRLNTPMIRHGTWGRAVVQVQHQPSSAQISKAAFLFPHIAITFKNKLHCT